MKYIRTKDGIWLFGGTHHNGDVIIGKKHGIDFGFCFDKKDILKQADTIEELCDLILCWQGKQWGFFVPLELEEINKEKWNKIYGAIWTDKGLIYVAKMNSKGKLELL